MVENNRLGRKVGEMLEILQITKRTERILNDMSRKDYYLEKRERSLNTNGRL
jgi:hypothetical protein